MTQTPTGFLTAKLLKKARAPIAQANSKHRENELEEEGVGMANRRLGKYNGGVEVLPRGRIGEGLTREQSAAKMAGLAGAEEEGEGRLSSGWSLQLTEGKVSSRDGARRDAAGTLIQHGKVSAGMILTRNWSGSRILGLACPGRRPSGFVKTGSRTTVPPDIRWLRSLV